MVDLKWSVPAHDNHDKTFVVVKLLAPRGVELKEDFCKKNAELGLDFAQIRQNFLYFC